MKVYLNERIIYFTATRPDTITAEDMFIVCDSRKELKKAIRDFVADPAIHHLYLHYQNDEQRKETLESFFSLFKIVEAAGGVVKDEYGEILFIHRLGYWDLPKGKISKKDRKIADGLVSGQANRRTSDLQISDFRFGSAELRFAPVPISENQHPASSIQHPVSSIQYPDYARIAAIREVQEETGLVRLTVTDELATTWHIYFRAGEMILKRTYWFGMLADVLQTLTPQTEEDIVEVRWISPSEFDDIREKCYTSLRELF